MSESEVKKLLKKHDKTWEQFIYWMRGQTVGVDDDGNYIYYEGDVSRFVNNRGIVD